MVNQLLVYQNNLAYVMEYVLHKNLRQNSLASIRQLFKTFFHLFTSQYEKEIVCFNVDSRCQSQPFKEKQMPLKNESVIYHTAFQPTIVRLMASNKKLAYTYSEGELKVQVPVGLRTNLVDVIEISL